METLKMSRGKTVPSTRKHSRSSPSARSELIVRKKDEKQSAKRRTVLDNHFYRTDLSLSRERPPPANVSDWWNLEKYDGLQPRASIRPLVGCSEKLGAGYRVASYSSTVLVAVSVIDRIPHHLSALVEGTTSTRNVAGGASASGLTILK